MAQSNYFTLLDLAIYSARGNFQKRGGTRNFCDRRDTSNITKGTRGARRGRQAARAISMKRQELYSLFAEEDKEERPTKKGWRRKMKAQEKLALIWEYCKHALD